MITLGYLISFCLFCFFLFFTWYIFLERKKGKRLFSLVTILCAFSFVTFSAIDAQDMVVRQQKASELADQEVETNSDGISAWYRNKYQEETNKMKAYQWDKTSLNLEHSKNLHTAAQMVKNIYIDYLQDIVRLDLEDGELQRFLKNRGEYLGKKVQLGGECLEMTDAAELSFSKEFTTENPSCQLEAYYCQYIDSTDKYIVWQVHTMWSIAKEDADMLDGVYIGQIMHQGNLYDVYIS